MNIYLDIDGTLLFKNKELIKNFKEFLTLALSKADVYWLTTHCKENNNEAVIRHLKPFVNEEEMKLIKQVKTTDWTTLKTEAIDFNKPFIWFDDFLLWAEKEQLKEEGVLDSWIKVSSLDDDILATLNSND